MFWVEDSWIVASGHWNLWVLEFRICYFTALGFTTFEVLCLGFLGFEFLDVGIPGFGMSGSWLCGTWEFYGVGSTFVYVWIQFLDFGF